MQLVIMPMPTYLRVVLTGTITIRDVAPTFAQVFAACRTHHRYKVLADLRGAEFRFTSPDVDAYLGMSDVTKEYRASIMAGQPAVQVAVIRPAPLRKAALLGANIASNRGLPMRVTTELAAAAAWLGIDLPPAPPPAS